MFFSLSAIISFRFQYELIQYILLPPTKCIFTSLSWAPFQVFSIILFARENLRVVKIPLPSHAHTLPLKHLPVQSEKDNQPYEMNRHVFACNVWGSIATEHNEPQKWKRG